MTDKQVKEKALSFEALCIPIGSILTFKKDSSISVKTLDGKNKVEYLGIPYSISTLAKQLVGSPVSGYLYFKYGDKLLKTLVKEAAGTSATPLSKTIANEEAVVSETDSDMDPLRDGFEETSIDVDCEYEEERQSPSQR